MFKKLLIGTLAAVIVVAAGASAYMALAAPSVEIQASSAIESIPTEIDIPTNASAPNHLAAPIQAIANTDLTSDEIAGLVYMFEEEKLARDVYNFLFSIWGQPTFQNIALSEQAHMDAIRQLLVQYNITVPDDVAGTFNIPSLQALYNDLVASGTLSLADALKVGATIEEVDILDLQAQIELTGNADILMVYNNLLTGSFNHLRNFVNVLSRQTGEIYQPQYLSAELYQTIISDSNGSGQVGANGSAAGNYANDTTKGSKGYHGGRP